METLARQNLKNHSKITDPKLNLFVISSNTEYKKILIRNLVYYSGYRLYSFNTGSDAIYTGKTRIPNIIVIDYPNEDSSENSNDNIEIDKLRLLFPEAGIVIVSDKDNCTTAFKCIKEGADKYFIKNDITIQRIHDVLGRMRYYSLMHQLSRTRETKNHWISLFFTILIGGLSLYILK